MTSFLHVGPFGNCQLLADHVAARDGLVRARRLRAPCHPPGRLLQANASCRGARPKAIGRVARRRAGCQLTRVGSVQRAKVVERVDKQARHAGWSRRVRLGDGEHVADTVIARGVEHTLRCRPQTAQRAASNG